MAFSFTDFPYIPTLAAMEAEISGFANVREPARKQILPVWTVGRLGQATHVAAAAAKVSEMMGNQRYVLRLDERHKKPDKDATKKTIEKYSAYNAAVDLLADPKDGFAHWREFAGAYPQAIACLPTSGDTASYQKAASELAGSGLAFALWIDATKTAPKSLEKYVGALVKAQNLDNVLVIVDLGAVINIPEQAKRFRKIRFDLLDSLTADQQGGLHLLATSTSFEPPKDGGLFLRRIRELDLFDACGGFAATLYGDYGSVARSQAGGRWIARVDYSKVLDWVISRGTEPLNSQEYSDCCEAIATCPQWEGPLDLWGVEQIEKNRTKVQPGCGSPAHWIAVRVNIHLIRQLARATDEYQKFLSNDPTPPHRHAEEIRPLRRLEE